MQQLCLPYIDDEDLRQAETDLGSNAMLLKIENTTRLKRSFAAVGTAAASARGGSQSIASVLVAAATAGNTGTTKKRSAIPKYDTNTLPNPAGSWTARGDYASSLHNAAEANSAARIGVNTSVEEHDEQPVQVADTLSQVASLSLAPAAPLSHARRPSASKSSSSVFLRSGINSSSNFSSFSSSTRSTPPDSPVKLEAHAEEAVPELPPAVQIASSPRASGDRIVALVPSSSFSSFSSSSSLSSIHTTAESDASGRTGPAVPRKPLAYSHVPSSSTVPSAVSLTSSSSTSGMTAISARMVERERERAKERERLGIRPTRASLSKTDEAAKGPNPAGRLLSGGSTSVSSGDGCDGFDFPLHPSLRESSKTSGRVVTQRVKRAAPTPTSQ